MKRIHEIFEERNDQFNENLFDEFIYSELVRTLIDQKTHPLTKVLITATYNIYILIASFTLQIILKIHKQLVKLQSTYNIESYQPNLI